MSKNPNFVCGSNIIFTRKNSERNYFIVSRSGLLTFGVIRLVIWACITLRRMFKDFVYGGYIRGEYQSLFSTRIFENEKVIRSLKWWSRNLWLVCQKLVNFFLFLFICCVNTLNVNFGNFRLSFCLLQLQSECWDIIIKMLQWAHSKPGFYLLHSPNQWESKNGIKWLLILLIK